MTTTENRSVWAGCSGFTMTWVSDRSRSLGLLPGRRPLPGLVMASCLQPTHGTSAGATRSLCMPGPQWILGCYHPHLALCQRPSTPCPPQPGLAWESRGRPRPPQAWQWAWHAVLLNCCPCSTWRPRDTGVASPAVLLWISLPHLGPTGPREALLAPSAPQLEQEHPVS